MCLGLLHGQRHAFAYLNNDHGHSTGSSIDDCGHAVHVEHGMDMTASPRSGVVFGWMDMYHENVIRYWRQAHRVEW